MTGPGWLERTNPHGSFGKLAAKVKEHLGDQSAGRALENSLGKTDKGQKSADWWAENARVIDALASVLGRQRAEVNEWVRACTAAPSRGWTSPFLRSVRAVPVEQPPRGLWPFEVEEWLGRLERDAEPVTRGWFQAEPGLPVDWLAARMERRGWAICRGKPWAEAVRRLPERGRVLVVLDEPVSRQLVQQARIPRRATLLVAAPHRLAHYGERTGMTGQRAGNPRRGRDRMAVWEGWALLDDNGRIRDVAHWFQEHALLDRRPSEERIAEVLDRHAPRTPPTNERRVLSGEALLLLDVAADDDPVDAWLDRLDPSDAALLDAIEDEAIRQGIGTSRPLDVWAALVPRRTDDAATLRAVRKALSHGQGRRAQELADGSPKVIIERLREEGHLCRDPDSVATWVLWPRWVGRELRRRAGARLAKDPIERGTALLDLDDEIARRALEDLLDLARDGQWETLRRAAATAPSHLEDVAQVEGVALALGQYVLDGGDLPPEVADEVARHLVVVRGAAGGGWRRLLCRGDGVFGERSTEAAEWALGARCTSVLHPAFGPWDRAEALAPVHQQRLEAFQEELNDLANRRRWERAAEYDSLLSRRLFRLGTLLYRARGLIEALEEVWSIQVPALLSDVASGASDLPGRAVREVLAEIAPDVPLPRDLKNIDLLGDIVLVPGEMPSEHQTEAFTQRLRAMILARLASMDEQVRRRDQALAQVRAVGDEHFADVAREIDDTGGGIVDVVRWLWGHWSVERSWVGELPPIRALERDDYASARLLWNLAPPNLDRAIWAKASEKAALWRVLDPSAWCAWARCGLGHEAGWRQIPEEVLVSLFDEGLCDPGWSAAWSRLPDATARWLVRALHGPTPPASTRDALMAVDPAHVPTLLKQAPDGALPEAWLQFVVRERHDGWREAWRRLQGHNGGPSS